MRQPGKPPESVGDTESLEKLRVSLQGLGEQKGLGEAPCSCPSCSCPSSSRLQYVTPYGNYSTRTRTTRTRIVLFRNSPQYGTRANTVQVPYSYEYSYAASRHDVRASTCKLFAICNALPFDNLGQMSDKTKQFCQR